MSAPLVGGRYELIRPLANGGMAEVLLARSRQPAGAGKRVVIKRVLPHLSNNAEFRALFEDEARLALQIDHPHVVEVFELVEDAGGLALVMEYVDGPDLRTLLRARHEHHEPVDHRLCARLIAQACEGLSAAHDTRRADDGAPLHIVHRDVSPENLLVARHGAVKVADFGIARAESRVASSDARLVRGKFHYMAPEQFTRGAIDRRTDLWAVGATLYELIADRKAYPYKTPAEVVSAVLHDAPPDVRAECPDCPVELADIVERCLKKSPSERYADCRDVLRDLEAFIAHGGPPLSSLEVAAWVERLCPAAGAATVEPTPAVPVVPPLADEPSLPPMFAAPSESTVVAPAANEDVPPRASPDLPWVPESGTLVGPASSAAEVRTTTMAGADPAARHAHLPCRSRQWLAPATGTPPTGQVLTRRRRLRTRTSQGVAPELPQASAPRRLGWRLALCAGLLLGCGAGVAHNAVTFTPPGVPEAVQLDTASEPSGGVEAADVAAAWPAGPGAVSVRCDGPAK